MLGFIEKVTSAPERLASEDVEALRAEGLTHHAITNALYVCVGFNIINRVADALGVKVPPSKVFARGVKFSLLFGYKLLSGLQIGGGSSRRADRPEMDSAQVRSHAVDDPHASQVERLREAVLSGPGALEPALRRAASLAAGLPAALGPYVQKVARHAYTVTDEDIMALHQTGYSDDQVFELTVSAALGAGLMRLEAGLSALRGRAVMASMGTGEGS
jgi:alkylhydroperoxidase family enzyme